MKRPGVKSLLPWLLFASFLLRILYLSLRMPVWWDTHIYIGMGKYIFSLGQMGIWEPFRPLLHPFVLGVIWVLGFDPLIVGKILDVLFSLAAIYLVFLISSDIWNERVALAAAALFSFTGIFVMFSGLVLTEPLGLVLMLGGTWLFFKRRMFFSGVVFGMAFFTKFPLAIAAAAAGLSLIIEMLVIHLKYRSPLYHLHSPNLSSHNTAGGQGVYSCCAVSPNGTMMEHPIKKRPSLLVPELLRLTGGFVMVCGPYMVLNYILYGSPVLPLAEGSAIVTTYTWLYGNGWSYYIREFFLANWIYLLIVPFIFYFFRLKMYADFRIRAIVIATLLLLLYFHYVPRKEIRYLVLALPFLSMMSGWVALSWYDTLRRSRKPIIKPGAWAFICILIVLVSLPWAVYFERPPSFEVQIADIVKKYNLPGTILTSDPAPVSFLDNKIATLNGIIYAPKIYQNFHEKYDLLFVNTCDLSCPPQDSHCESEKFKLISRIKIENSIEIEREYKNCTYYVLIPTRISEQFYDIPIH